MACERFNEKYFVNKRNIIARVFLINLTMARATYDALLAVLLENDASKTFESILKRDGLPGDGLDYELLMTALRYNNKPICKLLLDSGCCVKKSDSRTSKPLFMAIRKVGWYSIVEKMLARGARVTDVEDNRVTALHSAFYNEASDCVVELLLNRFFEETTTDLRTKDGLGCLHIACARGSIDSVKRSLAISLDANIQVSSSSYYPFAGYSPLHFAVAKDRFDVADLLCENDADVYLQDHQGSTPIHLALENRNPAMLDILFQYDKKYQNYMNIYGFTHFMAACAGSNMLIAEQYLHTADDDPSTSAEALMTDRVPETRDHPFAGYSAFYFAVEFFSGNTLTLLFDRGAYCKLKKLLPVNVTCRMRRGFVFSLMKGHYTHCKTCRRMNFLYKRLACNNSGIRLLNGASRKECSNRNCAKIGLIFVGLIIIIVIVVAGFLIFLQDAESEIQEERSLTIPEVESVSKYHLRPYRPARY